MRKPSSHSSSNQTASESPDKDFTGIIPYPSRNFAYGEVLQHIRDCEGVTQDETVPYPYIAIPLRASLNEESVSELFRPLLTKLYEESLILGYQEGELENEEKSHNPNHHYLVLCFEKDVDLDRLQLNIGRIARELGLSEKLASWVSLPSHYEHPDFTGDENIVYTPQDNVRDVTGKILVLYADMLKKAIDNKSHEAPVRLHGQLRVTEDFITNLCATVERTCHRHRVPIDMMIDPTSDTTARFSVELANDAPQKRPSLLSRLHEAIDELKMAPEVSRH